MISSITWRRADRSKFFLCRKATPLGGVGKVTSSIIRALVMTSLTSGMNLMGIDFSSQYIARVAVLANAVIFDVTTRSRGKNRRIFQI